MTAEQAGHCGHELEIGLIDDELSGDPCDRPIWDDHDRCIWHAEVEGKSTEDFEDHEPDDQENLDEAYLRGATLIDVDWLADTSLIGADFRGATLNGSDLTGADMTLAKLADVSGINTDFSRTNLEQAIFTNADLRRATLEDARLSGAVLNDVHISDETEIDNTTIYERDPTQPRVTDKHPLEAASWAYRQLQRIYSANSLPDLARQSYVSEKDTRRRLAWAQGNYRKAFISELSRWTTLYGTSPYRILLTSLLVISISAVLYPVTGGIEEINEGENIGYSIDNPERAPRWWITTVLFKSFYFSVVTFATLGYGDIQPIGSTARLLAGVETILGSLLTALLVFVLARLVTW
jgi:uncharacterized protein YjbI with pentapeptide repeats